MDGYAALITAVLVGGGSMATAVAGMIVQIRKGDPETKARMSAAEEEARKLRGKLLVAEAVIFRLKAILVREGLMTQGELERGEEEPPT